MSPNGSFSLEGCWPLTPWSLWVCSKHSWFSYLQLLSWMLLWNKARKNIWKWSKTIRFIVDLTYFQWHHWESSGTLQKFPFVWQIRLLFMRTGKWQNLTSKAENETILWHHRSVIYPNTFLCNLQISDTAGYKHPTSCFPLWSKLSSWTSLIVFFHFWTNISLVVNNFWFYLVNKR